MSFDVLKKIEELKKSDMICAEGKYELVKAEVLKDMNSAGLILRHKKSGARVVVISNDDNNKVFSIGFKTPPYKGFIQCYLRKPTSHRKRTLDSVWFKKISC